MKRGGKIISQVFENPALIKNISMEQIDAWISETPYVQYLHLLKALKLKSEKITDLKAYHKSATVVTDRVRMDELLSMLDSENSEQKNKKKEKVKSTDKMSTTEDIVSEEVDDSVSEISESAEIVKSAESEIEENAGIEEISGAAASSITELPIAAADSEPIYQGVDQENMTSSELPLIEEEEEEESIEDWDDVMSVDENEPISSDAVEASDVDEPVSRDDKAFSSNLELSEFTEWLLALDGQNDEVSQQQVDESVAVEGSAVSETLAKVLAAQGHKGQAVDMYRKLSLTNPEKSAYFAALIQKLEKQ